ncbi:MAG: hypothetical protein ACHP7N_12035, partial [Caulobacterales bacterium]
MRICLAFAFLALPPVALAAETAAVGDRYGPPPAHAQIAPSAAIAAPMSTPAPTPYRGPFLRWAGKNEASAPLAAPAPAAPAQPTVAPAPTSIYA